MPIIDTQLLFSDNQAITTSAQSTNNLRVGKQEPGQVDEIKFAALVTEDFAGLTSLKIEFRTSENADRSDSVVIGESRDYQADELKQGTRINVPYFPLDTKEHIDVFYNVTGTATAGRISSFLNFGVTTNV